jgi:ribulose-5-phosphate 4-epimerase/fuculose-1-phosphate aldolase
MLDKFLSKLSDASWLVLELNSRSPKILEKAQSRENTINLKCYKLLPQFLASSVRHSRATQAENPLFGVP